MCDAIDMLKTMKQYQIRPDPVVCTCTNRCWCNNLSFRFPVSQIVGDCMSPEELLATHGMDMTARDREYIEGLTNREFIPN